MTKQASPPPRGDKSTPTAPPAPPPWRHWLWGIALAIFVVLYFVLPATRITQPVNLTYSRFLKDVAAHQVKTVTITSTGGASGTLANGTKYTTEIPIQLAGQTLLNELERDNVQIDATSSGPSFGSEVLSWVILLLPFVIIGYIWFRLSRGASSQLQGVMGVGKSRAKVFDADRPKTTFADVAGYDGAKQEIVEVVDFLRHPDRYRRAGAMAPRGILMVGPPGTGKTLLARAVAGEADVPFFSVSGSSFVEMFVGVGAARVRDLFAEARKRAPAIIFVDEIDAIGQRRSGSGAFVANDEREQTLNQLLAEMDGFDMSEGIVVLAATNRPEVLDPALLRPGRFDRQVTIPLPVLAERVAILAVHSRDKRLDPSVDLEVVARGTPGFSGADLANLVNEAAIFAVRDNREVIRASDFEAARDRILLGRRESSNVLLPEEKHAVAVHEAGHALVAALRPKADPVAKVTILPAGQALGVTEQLPLVERHLYGEDYLYDALAVRLGGRAAELVELGQASSGAANDLANATDLAVRMVREFGLSAKLGPVGYPQGGSVFLGSEGPGLSSRPFAEETQAIIDSEVSALLRRAEQQAIELLNENHEKLRRLVDLLLARETVDGSEVYAIAGVPEPTGISAGATLAPERAAATATKPVPATVPATDHSSHVPAERAPSKRPPP
ncbi:MAG: ATP-dependent zinc metalloprotease FtsH [Acidimicrobiaceae bacterium]|jgi:cell division protease FtsH|nr:ATP-dependent zinc metalloprotease FtsH [Acidimicrobiaceae bacterium]